MSQVGNNVPGNLNGPNNNIGGGSNPGIIPNGFNGNGGNGNGSPTGNPGGIGGGNGGGGPGAAPGPIPGQNPGPGTGLVGGNNNPWGGGPGGGPPTNNGNPNVNPNPGNNNPIGPNNPLGPNNPNGPNNPLGPNNPNGPNNPLGPNNPVTPADGTAPPGAINPPNPPNGLGINVPTQGQGQGQGGQTGQDTTLLPCNPWTPGPQILQAGTPSFQLVGCVTTQNGIFCRDTDTGGANPSCAINILNPQCSSQVVPLTLRNNNSTGPNSTQTFNQVRVIGCTDVAGGTSYKCVGRGGAGLLDCLGSNVERHENEHPVTTTSDSPKKKGDEGKSSANSVSEGAKASGKALSWKSLAMIVLFIQTLLYVS